MICKLIVWFSWFMLMPLPTYLYSSAEKRIQWWWWSSVGGGRVLLLLIASHCICVLWQNYWRNGDFLIVVVLIHSSLHISSSLCGRFYCIVSPEEFRTVVPLSSVLLFPPLYFPSNYLCHWPICCTPSGRRRLLSVFLCGTAVVKSCPHHQL